MHEFCVQDWRSLHHDSDLAWHRRAVLADRKRKRNATFCKPSGNSMLETVSGVLTGTTPHFTRQPTV